MTPLRFGSVASGIEAASVAWSPLGWHAAWFSEIEPFPCSVLAHRYPNIPNHGDMLTLAARIATGEVEAPPMLCGGTPCQAFSVAGLRQSLDDDRGNLTLTFCEIADAIDSVRTARGEEPCIVFWENVPGVLTTKDNAFGCFLGQLAGEDEALQPPGKKWPDAGCVFGPKRAIAWRVLDAQYFGLAQRRKRVFVVASARNGFSPTEVLFEREGSRRDTAPLREQGQEVAGTAGAGVATGCWWDGGQVSQTLDAVLAKGQMMPEKNRFPVVICFNWMNGGGYGNANEGLGIPENHTPPLSRSQVPAIASADVAARRITPREGERLQGFEDDWTLIPGATDTARYKAIGNSWPVNTVRWIGRRIQKELGCV